MDDDQQFCLRWNNHQSTLVAVFDTLLENEKLVDCTLAAEGKFLNAHKVVLSACSPYFESLLSRHYDKHPILILKDVKFQELKAMMDYMYRGEVNISQDQLGALLKAAESLQIKGLSDNKKDDQPVNKRPAPAPAPPKSPQPQAPLPKVQGLTIEQRSRDDREGSISPGPRKKKRMRRKSEEMDNHHDASNSSDAHSLPPQNIPVATTQLPANIKLNSDVPDTIETKQEILTRHKEEIGSQQQQVPMIKEKLETHTELMLEPKSEYVEEMNEDSIEDLTLDDDDISNMDQMDDGAGPSHGGEGSSQGFGHWQMGNQSQDEVFLAAQEAVGAHRDSQGSRFRASQFLRRQNQYEARKDFGRRPPVYYTASRDIDLLGERRRYTPPNADIAGRRAREFELQSYQKSVNKVNLQKIVEDRRLISGAQPISKENSSTVRKTQMFVAPPPPKLTGKTVSKRPFEKGPPDAPKKLDEVKDSFYTETLKTVSQEVLEKQISISTKTSSTDQAINRERNYQGIQEPQSHPKFSKPAPPRSVEERTLLTSTKPSVTQGSGLLTDSLSCIFTRRPQKNNQHKIPQKRVFFEEIPQRTEDQNDKKDHVRVSESAYLEKSEEKTRYESPEKECPEPPIISQATPNLSNEDWFATKQRILSSVNHDRPAKTISEPQPPRLNACPEPPQITVDPHGFDIEPPDHLNKNVSPYVPSYSLERDEYNKYKSQKLREEVLILAQKRYKQGFEAPSEKSKMTQESKQPATSYLKDTEVKEKVSLKEDRSTYQQYQGFESQPQLQGVPAYEPKSTAHDTQQLGVTYEPTRRYDPETSGLQTEDREQYEYHQTSYNPASYEEQPGCYENEPFSYQGEHLAYYDKQNSYKQSSYNEPLAPQEMYATETSPSFDTAQHTNYGLENLENMCPEAPHISEDSEMIKEEPQNSPPEAPVISQREEDEIDASAPSYYPDDSYRGYENFEEQHHFKEPPIHGTGAGNQQMCHRCSFQTTNAKKLRDHLKFVHGEAVSDVGLPGSQQSNDLFSRREPKPEGQNDLFTRRDVARNEEIPQEREHQKPFQGRFKRRNTASAVNIISSDVIVPARNETGDAAEVNMGEVSHEGEKVRGEAQDSGVLAAMEYFETTKDQPKKPRPYKRNQDELLEDDWI